MTTSVSGKFVSARSNYLAEDNIEEIAKEIPATPTAPVSGKENPVVDFLKEYFGRFWWLWIVVLLILKLK